MPKTPQSSLPVRAVRRLLRPLACLLLRHGMSYATFAEAAKLAFIDSAQADFAIAGKKQTTSRISTITGLSRKEVFRLQHLAEQPGMEKNRLNRAARVINGWLTDPRFSDGSGQPGALHFDASENSFTQLVKDYSGDITARTIADELTRIQAIDLNGNGDLVLTQRAYIPQPGSDERMQMLADDVFSLITTIAHNMDSDDVTQQRFQRKIYYDNVPQQFIEEIRADISQHAQRCLEEINKKIKTYDRDENPARQGNGRFKVGLGIHYIEEPVE